MKVIVTYEVWFPGHSTRCSWISDSKPGYRRRKRGRRQVKYPGSARKTGNDAFSLYALCKLKWNVSVISWRTNRQWVVSDVARKAFASAANYEHVRSEYAVEAVEFLLQKLGLKDNDAPNRTGNRPFTILELGCGTGKFTRVMVKVLTGKKVKVFASEPLQSMCEQFKLMVPETEIIQCAAEKIRK